MCSKQNKEMVASQDDGMNSINVQLGFRGGSNSCNSCGMMISGALGHLGAGINSPNNAIRHPF